MLKLILTIIGFSILLLVGSVFFLIKIFKTIKKMIPNKNEYNQLFKELNNLKTTLNKNKVTK